MLTWLVYFVVKDEAKQNKNQEIQKISLSQN